MFSSSMKSLEGQSSSPGACSKSCIGEAIAVKQVEAPETKICLSSCHRRGCCGPKEETENVVMQLVEGDERSRAVSIVGMGSIGKTTLAKKVYNDAELFIVFKIIEHEFMHR
ncbi:hypothetical protein CK203_022241 [Vitis vinifera]|uniref:NB-ARC domain-containing protein n=1 Tax=Vitis vinifera TaxID=29760 RepID=A0A438I9G2_VITVI|nr:hypothetical protein CK203_022241 [Vitis vinifera]